MSKRVFYPDTNDGSSTSTWRGERAGYCRSLSHHGLGRGCGVGRGLGNGVDLGVAVGVGVTTGVGLGVTVEVGVGVGVGLGRHVLTTSTKRATTC
jgi:hypothetical protein